MRIKLLSTIVCIVSVMLVSVSWAEEIGLSSGCPGYSAKDILNQGYSVGNVVYWIDPDLPGGNAPFQVFADMTTSGGGWTLSNDTFLGQPDMSAQLSSINILAVNQDAEIRFVDSDLDVWYLGRYFQPEPLNSVATWTINIGNPSELFGKTWVTLSSQYDIYVRETNTVQYPTAAIPEPTTMLLLGIGLIGLAGRAVKRRFKRVKK